MDVQITWALGSLFVGVMAWAVLSFGYSWRWLALIAAVPPFAVLFCFTFIPESPRWLIANGRQAEAKTVLRKIAKRNGVELTNIAIVPEEVSCTLRVRGGLRDFWFHPVGIKNVPVRIACTVRHIE